MGSLVDRTTRYFRESKIPKKLRRLDLSGNLHASADQNFPCVAKIIYQLRWNCTHGVLRELQLRKTDISPEQAESLAEIGAGDGIVVQL